MPLDAAWSVVTPVSPHPQPRAQPSPRRGPQLRSGEEPGVQHSSDTSNFSSSVNKNGEDKEVESFWEDSQHIRAPFGIFHGVPGVQCSGTRNTEWWVTSNCFRETLTLWLNWFRETLSLSLKCRGTIVKEDGKRCDAVTWLMEFVFWMVNYYLWNKFKIR